LVSLASTKIEISISSTAFVICYATCYVFQTHILRKNVQVRKSQSADNLAPFTVSGPSKEHDIDLVG